ncbi:Hsp70 family protein [Streptomyces sp. NPDC006458]|uniref:Hsp70 family protein n=1 Tax=Streptomyces sp. NPDC006458 TaxID=3154302 RepID=UPI0033AE3E48
MYGIDVGHRYGRIARRDGDGRPVVATVAFGPGGPGTAAAAVTALASARDAPSQRSVALALPLDEDGERAEGALLRAAEGAGLTVLHTIAEPVAVALHYRAVVEGTDRTVLVYDQGATTLDLAVLAVAHDRTVRIVDAERHPVGGDDWDAAVAAELLHRTPDLEPSAALAAAERLRRALDGQGAEAATERIGETEAVLDRETLDRLVRPLRERARRAVADLCARTTSPPDTVLLAGGLAATPGTDAWLESALALQVRSADPAHAVVGGLLHLADFGALRVRSGPAPHREDPEPQSIARRAGAEPWPAGHPEDPPSRSANRREDPEPASRAPHAADPEPEQELKPEPEPEPEPQAEPIPAPAPAPAAPRADQEPERQPRSDPPPEPPVALAPENLFAVPVDELQAIRRGTHLLVLWAWPPGSRTARVRWRVEGDTVGGSRDTGDIRCSRRVYEHDGGLDLPVGRAAVTLTVEVLVAGPAVDCEGSSALLVDAEPPVVEYEPSVRRRLGGRVATVTFTSDSGCLLPALRIVHGVGHYRPSSAAEGTVVHDLPAQPITARVPLRVEFPLPATRGTSWLVCFPAHPDAASDSDSDSAPDVRPTALHRLRVT